MAASERPNGHLSADPTITVVIPAHEAGGIVSQTLASLRQLGFPLTEVLVVDQTGDGGTRQAVLEAAEMDGRVHYMPCSTTKSSVARNEAVWRSQSEVVAFIDDDCVIGPTWLEAMIAEFRQSEVIAVFGRVVADAAGRHALTDEGVKGGLERREFAGRTAPWYIGHSPCMAFRRANLIKIDGFDPLLGAGGPFGLNEDGDVAYRLLAAGDPVVYSPKLLVYRRHGTDWAARRRRERAYGRGAGAQFAKYFRSSDRYGLTLLRTWIWELGVRRLGAGLLKWRSLRVMYLGYCQLVYPWIGIWRSVGYQIDPAHLTYVFPVKPMPRRWKRVRRPKRTGKLRLERPGP
jgi:glycosyltransferase involved in cell wall biosynthesis